MTERAFTLAEVLITLAIIGVVAAMTMPALIADYQKSVATAKLKKFYSVLSQAVRTNYAENDTERDCSAISNSPNDPVSMEEFFNRNFKPYIRTVTPVERTAKGIMVGLPDGGGMYIRKIVAGEDCSGTWIIYCLKYKDCRAITEDSFVSDGKKTFVFATNGTTPFQGSVIARDTLKSDCAKTGSRVYCSTLIHRDGWEIKPDYPAW